MTVEYALQYAPQYAPQYAHNYDTKKVRGYFQAVATLFTGKGTSVPLQLAAEKVLVEGWNP